MANAENKTTENDNSVDEFLNTIQDANKREDCCKIIELMRRQTGYEPKMWGTAIIGFGSYHYKYKTGREGDAPLAGFSPRKNYIAIYFESEYDGREELLSRLGKHKTAKVCVYINKLAEIDTEVLKQMITASVAKTKKLFP